MKRFVLDLGTNTFHLLIAKVDNNGHFAEIYRERKYVFLGQDGLECISQKVIKRATSALEHFSDVLKKHDCHIGKIVATEGLRKTSNATVLLNKWSALFPVPIHIISGQQEAQYIAQGVLLAIDNKKVSGLAIDIGGGSIEIIIIKKGEIGYSMSFPLGLSVLYSKYQGEKPMTSAQYDIMYNHLQQQLLQPFIEQIANLTEPVFIGVSGCFEIFQTDGSWENTKLDYMDVTQLDDLIDDCIDKDIKQLDVLEWLPTTRSQYVLEALAIVQVFTKSSLFHEFLFCPYTLKEGLLIEVRQV